MEAREEAGKKIWRRCSAVISLITGMTAGVFRGKMDGSRPISRVLSWTAIPLGRALLRGSSDQPAGDAGRVIACLFGLAPGGVCHAVRVATSAVGSYPAVSPLPVPSALQLAVIGGLFSVALSVAFAARSPLRLITPGR